MVLMNNDVSKQTDSKAPEAMPHTFGTPERANETRAEALARITVKSDANLQRSYWIVSTAAQMAVFNEPAGRAFLDTYELWITMQLADIANDTAEFVSRFGEL